jgi:hypothetical protein
MLLPRYTSHFSLQGLCACKAVLLAKLKAIDNTVEFVKYKQAGCAVSQMVGRNFSGLSYMFRSLPR